ncbi:MAG: hypothetical protein Q8M92_04500 [Candidatus Subteraquimicrobiales bacterium]|nr:hypothetical protein [Candidatus Subteraquimicrobiales bacterium]
MKIPLHLNPCEECRRERIIWINLHDTKFDEKCECGNTTPAYLSSDISIGYKLLYRSNHECRFNKDFPLSIVFSATAFDCELTRLHNKWAAIGKIENEITSQELDKILRSYKGIIEKIQKTSELMYPAGFNNFAKTTPKINEIIEGGFPSLDVDSLAKDIQQHLFWPRNSILHTGKNDYKEDDAIKAYNISTLGLLVLNSLDNYKKMK